MSELIVPLLFVVTGGVVGLVFAARAHGLRKVFARGFVDDADYGCDPPGFFSVPEVKSRHSALPLRLKPGSTGGKYPTHFWRVWMTGIALGQRTTLTLEIEGLEGRLREKLGISDIKTGDADFDREWCIRGSDPDVIRGVVNRPAVREAMRSMWVGRGIRVCKLDKHGDLSVELNRAGADLDVRDARYVLERVRQLGEALHASSSAKALPAPGAVSSVSSSSGSPVGLRSR